MIGYVGIFKQSHPVNTHENYELRVAVLFFLYLNMKHDKFQSELKKKNFS